MRARAHDAWAAVAVAVVVAVVSGCAPRFPRNDPEDLDVAVRDIPQGAAPVYLWHGEHNDLRTYWGRLAVTLEVAAYLPPGWKQAGDGFWRVEAQTTEGKPLPFIGVIHRYVNENGTPLASLVPGIDLRKAPTGLYIVIDPQVELKDGRVAAIRPMAYVADISNHAWTPFRPKIFLFPDAPSKITPPPENVPEPIRGTPIQMD